MLGIFQALSKDYVKRKGVIYAQWDPLAFNLKMKAKVPKEL